MIRHPRSAYLFPFLVLALLAAMIAGICWGEAAQISPARALAIVLHKMGLAKGGDWPTNYEFIVLHVRAPRVVVAALVGAGLAVAGCLLQGLFNNPLASPDILGVSSGGALGAVFAIFLGVDVPVRALAIVLYRIGLASAGEWVSSHEFIFSLAWLPALAFLGALGASLAVYVIATHHGRTPTATLILAGIAINAILGAAVSFLLTLKIEEVEAARKIVYWLIGGLEDRLWQHVWMAAPPVALGCAASLFLARDLNSLALGEETAKSLGVSVQRFRIEILVVAAVMTGACVAVSGVLAFVGLVVPHLIRLAIGPDHRRLAPACALGGAVFLVLVDLASRVLNRPQGVRIGILTSLIGGPFFLGLLMWNRRKTEKI